ncbi:Lrp/AsnC family transcriptional regulator [Thermococcus sp. SY098]|uniref:Transcriptional regulator n=1 Tax=Thermococcus barophilus (strain DSM 11836 / MP) TaxID=391623 RepID=F0LGV2_THEBM|nr:MULTISPECIES: Lrp/AsnC family transcriptional regulator [Thermococcus]ADT82991.1 putative transcriptional regulator [Thermococcus barophilus MP]WRS52296.1 Lrp/AsnC family transcriptional regulator [Thermococcus sp. SY098]
MPDLDEIDREILLLLKDNARMSLTDIAKKVGLSVMGVKNRIKKLEERGIIEGYSANISLSRLGYDIMAFVEISVEARVRREVAEALQKRKEVIELYEVTGTCDFMAKIVVRNMEELREFLAITLAKMEGIISTQTLLIIRNYRIKFDKLL